jgi:glucokinase
LILAGDIGGTKSHLALVPLGDPGRRVREVVVPTADIESPTRTVADFAASSPRPLRAAVLGVAGPVLGNVVHGVNLRWSVDGPALSRALGIPVRLVNDLDASAHGVLELGPDELETLQPGIPREGPRVLVSPGTGLGESILLPHDGAWIAVAGEGAHADFAPRTDEEVELFRHLRARWGRATWERVVSGPGLVNVFCWLRDAQRVPDDSGVDAVAGDGAAAPAIGAAGVAGTSRLCAEAVRVWSHCLAAEAGNQALRVMARGGVYLGGGIPAKLLPLLREKAFLATFRAKEPHADWMREVPLHVILAADVVLRGAARLAAAAVPGAPRPV